ncbi:hypothetical protein BGZ80_002539 [Entomortierella chlamydospora]|uniref:BTB domain-containing protein n=1 Tax=Entomortierella chlamydospora TaxID=101097 RepID=A0A9P6T3N7_9FUNG|nr:hypothetical protein BGZ80_002539 [Entomortierella chlamydospora]
MALGAVEVSKVLRNGMYSFDIILSTIPQLPKPPEFPADPSKDYGNMMTLLKDIDTANVCFIVESGNTPSRVPWAHKCILEKYTKLAEIIQAASTTSKGRVNMEESMVSCPSTLVPDLLPAADYFGISDLRVRCEQAVIGSIEESNVMQILFSFGDRYEDIKEATLKYIVRNMALLIHGDKDPFEPYKSHASCNDILVEVMRRRDKRE